MKQQAKGQITLVKLADGSTANFFITKNGSTEQICADGVFSPNWALDKLTLTPVFKLGGSSVEVNFNWYEGAYNLDNVGSTPSLANGQLTISENLTIQDQKTYTCTATYTDPNTNSQSTAITYVTLSKITSGGTDVNVILSPAKGNGSEGLDYLDQNVSMISLKAQAYYGSDARNNNDVDSNSTSGVKYEWSIYESSTNLFVNIGATGITATGEESASDSKNKTAIYLKLNDLGESRFTTGDSENYVLMLAGDMIYIKKDAVDTKETFKCKATIVSIANNKVVGNIGFDEDIQTIRDLTDDYTVVINATATALNTSQQATEVTARLLQKGTDVTSKLDPTFDWDAYDVDMVSGSATEMWKEYRKGEGNVYTLIKLGEVEDGSTTNTKGYWLVGGTVNQSGSGDDTITTVTNPIHAQITSGNRVEAQTVTIYRSLIKNSSNVECTVRW